MPLDADPSWTVRPLASEPAHLLHAYFNLSPESPDGRWVLAFVSSRPDAHVGDLCLLSRLGGESRVLAAGIEVEDAHRQACQQFAGEGKFVVFHHLLDGVWQVESIEIDTGRRDILARNRQLGFGRAELLWVATMGLHWDPAADGDIHQVDVASGRCIGRVPLTSVRTQAVRLLGDPSLAAGPASLAFPLISPDGSRLVCKIAQPGSADFRSPDASVRRGLFAVDCRRGQVTASMVYWGHPAWHGDNRRLVTSINQRLTWFDTETGLCDVFTGLPEFAGAHPSFSPDGKQLVTDSYIDTDEGLIWRVCTIDTQTGRIEMIHTHKADQPATTSWRPPHLHPVFNATGHRLYFNVASRPWTLLHIAERIP